MVGPANRPDLSRGRLAAIVVVLALGVVLAGALLKEARPPLGIYSALLAWLVLLLALVRRKAWPRLGPVFFYDLVRTTRRSRHIPLRCLYASFLLLMLFLFYASWFSSRIAWDTLFREVTLHGRELPRFGESFLGAYLLTQFALVVLLTPAFTAGAIAEERENHTLQFLYLSDLSGREIVLGKLASRTSGLLLLLLTGLPVLALTQFWGGVDMQRLLAGFTATAATLFCLASLSLLFSVYSRRVLTALAGTYGVVLALGCAGLVALADRWYAPGVEINDLLWALAVAEVAAGYSLCELAAAGVALQRTPRARPKVVQPDGSLVGRVRRGGPDLRSTVRLQSPAILPHYRWPLLWKETRAVFPFPDHPSLFEIFAAAAALVCLLFMSIEDGPRSFMTTALRSGSVVIMLFMCLQVASLAATTVTRERDRQTLDGLLTLPVERSSILRAKWLGTLISAWPTAALLVIVWIAGVLSGAVHTRAVPLLALTVMIYTALVAMLGLYFSTACRTPFRALVWTLLVVFILALGPRLVPAEVVLWLPGRLLPGAVMDWFERVLEWGLTPPLPLWVFSRGRVEVLEEPAHSQQVVAAAAGLLAYGLAAVVLWGMARRRFERLGQ